MRDKPSKKTEKRRRFEWRVIRIPLTLLQIVILLALVAGGVAVGYHYRAHLRFFGLRLPVSLRVVLDKLGISSPGSRVEGGGGTQNLVEQRFATLAFVTGEVKVQRMGEMNWMSSESKMRLSTGDRVRTFGGARAEVVFDDGSVLKIKPDSLIIIGDLMENVQTKVRQSSVKLMVSSIEADIKKQVVEGSRFRLEMPSAVAEMGKAKISVDVGAGQDSKIKVYSGQVAVAAGQKSFAMNGLSQVSIGPGREVSDVSHIIAAPVVTAPRPLTKFVVNDPAKSSVAFRWLPVPKSAAYRLQIDVDRRFPKPVLERLDIRGTEFQTVGLAPAVYFGRVAAVDVSGAEGDYTEPVAFMIFLDRTPPEVTISKFVSSKAAAGYDVYLEGMTEPMAEIKLAGRPMIVDEQGRFSISLRGIPLKEKQVVLVAKDQAGNQTTVPLKVTGG